MPVGVSSDRHHHLPTTPSGSSRQLVKRDAQQLAQRDAQQLGATIHSLLNARTTRRPTRSKAGGDLPRRSKRFYLCQSRRLVTKPDVRARIGIPKRLLDDAVSSQNDKTSNTIQGWIRSSSPRQEINAALHSSFDTTFQIATATHHTTRCYT